jgi:capsular polysaccharide biosynthesis protein
MRLYATLFVLGIFASAAAPAQREEGRMVGHNEAPKRDARGIRVISDPPVTPRGVNRPTKEERPDPSETPTHDPPVKIYVPCSRSVTDGCKQTYEDAVADDSDSPHHDPKPSTGGCPNPDDPLCPEEQRR